jgi:putative copper export protein
VFPILDCIVLGVRAVSILAVFQAAGGYVFLRLFERELQDTALVIRSRVRWSALAAVVLSMTYYFLVPARMAGSFEGMFDAVLATIVSSSTIESAQVAAFAGLAVIAASIDVDDDFNRWLCLIGAAVAVFSFALTGHTTIHDLRLLLAPALVVHVAVAAFWFGSLWPLRIVAERVTPRARTEIVGRFSRYAMRAVPVLFLCGLLMAVIFVGSAAGLATPYAAMLGIKTAGFAGVLAIANVNRTRLAPAMARDDATAVRSFRRALTGEALGLAAVVVATAFMTGLFAPDGLHGTFDDGHDPQTHE